MANNNDEIIIEALREKYADALKYYNEVQAELKNAKEELNKCIYALRAWNEETIDVIEDAKPVEKALAETSKKEKIKLVYDSGATAKEKVIRVIKLNDRAMSKHQIAQYISEQESGKTIDEIKLYINAPVFQLVQDGVLAQSKLKGIKMKGYFYGNPEWLVEDGKWLGIHEPIIEDKTKQTNIWD